MGDRISSWAELQSEAPAILERLNADKRLGVAAATNPVIAMEHLGYVIAPDARQSIADRLRLGPEAADTLAGLRSEISRQAGREVDPDDMVQLGRLI